jgi:predicted MFS family arabinose efflux permease
MILTQRAIFSLGDDIRTRVNALYMASIFLAGACGSALGGWGIATGGWPLAAAFGVALTGGSLLFALLSRHASAGRV